MSDEMQRRAAEIERRIIKEESEAHLSEFGATLKGNSKLEELQAMLHPVCSKKHGANADNARIPGPAVTVVMRFTGELIVTWTGEGSMLLGNFEDGKRGVRTLDVDEAFTETIRHLIQRAKRMSCEIA